MFSPFFGVCGFFLVFLGLSNAMGEASPYLSQSLGGESFFCKLVEIFFVYHSGFINHPGCTTIIKVYLKFWRLCS